MPRALLEPSAAMQADRELASEDGSGDGTGLVWEPRGHVAKSVYPRM